ncbi:MULTISPECIES: IS66 family insertion sequence element accessory protein TnpB [unclassified Bradyrhizobium]
MDSDRRSAQVERLEVVDTGRRRRWSEDEKLKIVPESLQAPCQVAATARRYGVSRSLLLRWRRSFRPEPKDAAQQTKSGKLTKILWHDGLGMSLYAKRLERGRFLWPSSADGIVTITPAQLGYLLEGIDWRMPQHTWRPQAAG